MNDKRTQEDIHQAILNAAIIEFGKMGFSAASTNEIVKKANVSKGSLFNHFTNKERLYAACQIFVLEKYAAYMSEHKDFTSPDIFDRILVNLKIKMDFGFKNPDYLGIINRAWNLESSKNTMKIPEEFVMKAMKVQADLFFQGIDTSRFRDGINPEKIINYTRMMLDAHWKQFSNKYENRLEDIISDMESYFAEAEEIIDLLKNGAFLIKKD